MRLRLARFATTFLPASQVSPTLSFVTPFPSSSTCLSYTPYSSTSIFFLSFLHGSFPRFVSGSGSKTTVEQQAATDMNSVESTECNATDDSNNKMSSPPLSEMYDAEYPGTAVQRMKAVRERVSRLAIDGSLDGPWEEVRRKLLWAGGLRDLPDARPGQGYTGHSFNDFNHVDLTTMNDDSSDNLHDGAVKGIAVGNRLGPGIHLASLPDLGPGGSWSTCATGCNSNPPKDVAHIQFRSRIAFKLVWVPNENYDTFVLVDDGGKLLAMGKPSGSLPRLREREMNYHIMKGSKYSTAAKSLTLNSTLIK